MNAPPRGLRRLSALRAADRQWRATLCAANRQWRATLCAANRQWRATLCAANRQWRATLCAALLAASVLPVLSGCNLLGDGPSPKAIGKPANLDPEADTFLDADTRDFIWLEELRRTGKTDSLLKIGSFKIQHTRDTTLAGELRPFLDVASSFSGAQPAPASFLARLGLRATRLHFDTLRIPDAGPPYRFPETPAVGWRLDTMVGALRFVRHLHRVETITEAGLKHETWAFAESTWWAAEPQALLGTGTSWMGRTGLVKHQSFWPGFATSAGEGTLVRTLAAD